MKLDLAGKAVDGILFEYGVTVQVEGGTLLIFESAFSITHSNGRRVMVDPQGIGGSPDILVALHDEVLSAEFEEAGTLRVVMKRSTWFAEPSAAHESWSILSNGNPARVLCGPGPFNVSIWS